MEYLRRRLPSAKRNMNDMVEYYVGNTFYIKVLYPFKYFIRFSKVYSFGNWNIMKYLEAILLVRSES